MMNIFLLGGSHSSSGNAICTTKVTLQSETAKFFLPWHWNNLTLWFQKPFCVALKNNKKKSLLFVSFYNLKNLFHYVHASETSVGAVN